MKFLASALSALVVLPVGSSLLQTPTLAPPSQPQPSATTQKTTQQSSADILRDFKSYYIKSDTIYLHRETLLKELEKRAEFSAWGLNPAGDSQAADVVVVITLPFLTWEWNYRMVYQATGVELGKGKVSAGAETTAAPQLAAMIVKRIHEARPLPAFFQEAESTGSANSTKEKGQDPVAKESQPTALPAAKEELLGELAANIRPLAHTFGDALVMGYTASSYCLSPDGRRFAAVGRTSKNKWLVVVDGKAGPEFEGEGPQDPGVASLVFSADSQHISYRAHTGARRWDDVVDGQVGGVLREEVFACGSSRELRARPANLEAPTSADKAGQQIEFVMAGPTFSLDNRHAATVTWARNTVRVNLDGSPTKELHVPPGLPIYTAAGQHAEVPRHWIYESAGNIPNPLVSIPGVLGSLPIDFLRSKGVEFAEQLVFSPDGQRLAFVLGHGGHMFDGRGASRRAERQIIVDGHEGHLYNCDALLNLMFSADSRHVAIEAYKAAWGKSFVIIDGIEGKHYEELLGATSGQGGTGLRFQEDNSLMYLAREGRKFYRVTQPLP